MCNFSYNRKSDHVPVIATVEKGLKRSPTQGKLQKDHTQILTQKSGTIVSEQLPVQR